MTIGTDDDRSRTYRFTVLGHHAARLSDNEPQITVSVLAGPRDRLVYCGTLTMAEREWEVLSRALIDALPGAVEIDDRRSE